MGRKEELNERQRELIKAIGKRMQQLRKSENFSNYEDYAYEKGINRSQYRKYEAGSVDLQISTLFKVIESYEGMTIQEFFKDLDF